MTQKAHDPVKFIRLFIGFSMKQTTLLNKPD